MCGLIYCRAKDKNRSVNKEIIKQFHRQRSRGVLGFGLYDVEFQHIVKETAEKKILRYLHNHPSDEILFHHRYPTSTPNTKIGAHPYSTKNYFGDTEYILIHNGVIRNSFELASDHEKMGITYQSTHENGEFNDSESLLWDFALYMEGINDKLHAEGGAAFICVEKHRDDPKQNRLHYFRNISYPLYVRENARYFFLQSETDKDLKGKEIDAGQLYSYIYETGETTKTALELPTWKSTHYSPQHSYNSGETRRVLPYSDDDEQGWSGEYLSDEQAEDDEINRIMDSYDDEVDTAKQMMQQLYYDSEKMATDFKAKVTEALEYTKGNYTEAVGLLRLELEELDDKAFNVQDWYDKEVIKGALAILIADPFWDTKDATAVHPVWIERAANEARRSAEDSTIQDDVESKTSSPMALLTQKGQQLALEDALNAAEGRNNNDSHDSRDETQLIRDIIKSRSRQIIAHASASRFFGASTGTAFQIESSPSLIHRIPKLDEEFVSVGMPMKV